MSEVEQLQKQLRKLEQTVGDLQEQLREKTATRDEFSVLQKKVDDMAFAMMQNR